MYTYIFFLKKGGRSSSQLLSSPGQESIVYPTYFDEKNGGTEYNIPLTCWLFLLAPSLLCEEQIKKSV